MLNKNHSISNLFKVYYPSTILASAESTGEPLIAYYCIEVDLTIVRAWVLIGLAMRFAYALGLHIRNEERISSVARNEILGRIWWGHFAFERFLSATIGRPSQGVDRSCSVPFPLPIPTGDIQVSIIESRFGRSLETFTGLYPRAHPNTSLAPSSSSSTRTESIVTAPESANSGTYLKNVIRLCEVMQEALHLYGTSTVGMSWQSIQRSIASLNEELDVWATSLPMGLNFFHRTTPHGHRYQREQNTLDILYHNTKILVNRPCLCRLGRRIVNQTASSNDFNERGATTCIASAKAIAGLLPEDPYHHLVDLYETGVSISMSDASIKRRLTHVDF